MRNILLILFLMALVDCAHGIQVDPIIMTSPDNNQVITINIQDEIIFSFRYKTYEIIKEGRIRLDTDDARRGHNPKLLDQKRSEVDRLIYADVPTRSSEIRDHYNELILLFEGNYSVTFRAFNDGIAYRFETHVKEEQIIRNEVLDVTLADDLLTYFPAEERFISHFERSYEKSLLSEIQDEAFCSLPVLFQTPDRVNILVTEADLYDYPALFLKKKHTNRLEGVFPKVVLESLPVKGRGYDRNEVIRREANYIAKTSGSRTFPWRVFIISDTDADLLTTNLVYQLSRPLQLQQTKWIQPGKVAWDWWNANNIYGVDFKSGLNTQTYKFYIDFASDFGLDYIILDEGWSESTLDIQNWRQEIDVKELIAYGQNKHVGIILWTLWKPLDADMETTLDLYQKWGVKGIKVDFMQRADQDMVNFYERTAREAAKRHLLVDFHGAFKPAGLSRAYPNVLSYEGVKGMEHVKWSRDITPEHDLILPFIRMVAGPMDYTPGAMDNAHPENFTIRYSRPMSMGTRCHQLAMYIIYESPLQMLADNPSNYFREEESARFISKIPTVWNQTIVLSAKVSDYVVVARRNGDMWYIGGLTDETPCELMVDLSFLPEADYDIEIFQDGTNADRTAIDYTRKLRTLRNSDSLSIKMVRGGGFAAIISKK